MMTHFQLTSATISRVHVAGCLLQMAQMRTGQQAAATYNKALTILRQEFGDNQIICDLQKEMVR